MTKTVREKIEAGDYDVKIPYVREYRAKWCAEEAANTLRFKADLLVEYGLADHPSGPAAFSLAWDHGHSAGYSDVATYFDDYASLLTPDHTAELLAALNDCADALQDLGYGPTRSYENARALIAKLGG